MGKYCPVMTTPLYPLRFKPVYKDYVWGGTRLTEQYGRDTGGGICAESWEVACLKDGMSVVENGPLAGRTLESLIAEYGKDLVGDRFAGKPFPLLIKLLDAREKLSLQVHPDETTAPLSGGEPKTEAWYILDALPGAGVYAGFKDGVGPADFEAALKTNTLETLLNWIPVAPGQTIFIPGGRVHAIGAGCLILEVQQTSNTTFRLHDWGRVGAHGKGRPLHVDEARKAIRWDFDEPALCSSEVWESSTGGTTRLLLDCPFFCLMQRKSASWTTMPMEEWQSFECLFVVMGRIRVRAKNFEVDVKAGETVFIPASLIDVAWVPLGGDAELVSITPRPPNAGI